MNEKIIWQYWENPPQYPDGIPYINLCHESVDLHSNNGNNYKVIRLNEHTIFDYLSKDELNPLIFKLQGNENQIAQRVDYYRAKLLCKYGGIWLDSDAIALRNFDFIFDKLKTYDFYGYMSNVPNIWCFACNKNAPIMLKWCENNEKILETNDTFFYGELGHKSLELFKDVGNNFWQSILDNPLNIYFNNWRFLYIQDPDSIKDYLNIDHFPFVMLYNALVDTPFKKLTKEEIKNTKNLLSLLFMEAGVL